MILSTNPARRARPRARLAVGASLLALLAGCGGGGDTYHEFSPQRMFSFGDEASALTVDGRRYAVNVLVTASDGSTAIDCTASPIWVQALANHYGFVFPECNPQGVATPQAKDYAVAGAKVADVAAQIDAQVAASGINGDDVTTVLAGANDIVELYRQYPARSEDDLVAEARRRGSLLADQVNRLVDYGARVLLSNVPDLGLTPYALAEKAAHADIDRADLLTRLSQAFNEELGVDIVLDGRFIGLVQTEQRVQSMVRHAGDYGFDNVTDAACTVALPDCTTATLVTGAEANKWLWADELRMGNELQYYMGQLAIDRARNNPF
jgi:phospholipase/lecithinase/hemolysin